MAASGSVLCSGYLVLDIVSHGKVLARTAGGTAGNVAANLSWLGHTSALLSRIGTDPAGDAVVADLAANGVDPGWLQRDPDVETPCLVHRVGNRGHSYSFSCSDCGRRFQSYRPPDMIGLPKTVRTFFFDRAGATTVALAEMVRERGGLVVFEPNGLGRESLTRRAMSLAQVVKISEDRQDALAPAKPPKYKPQLEIVTMGARGLRFRLAGQRWNSLAPFPTSVIDAGGAGDWVTAGLLSSLSMDQIKERDAVATALRVGQSLASHSCTFLGARGMATNAKPADVAELVSSRVRSAIPIPRGYRPPASISLGSTSLHCPTCLTPTGDPHEPTRVVGRELMLSG